MRVFQGSEYRGRAICAESHMQHFGTSMSWTLSNELDAGYCLDAICDIPTGRVVRVAREGSGVAPFVAVETWPIRF